MTSGTFFAVAVLCLTFLAVSVRVSSGSSVPCDCHTWHNVTAVKGTWNVEIAAIYEPADFYMSNCTRWADSTNTSVARFAISSEENGGVSQFGYLPVTGDTFDCAYSMTIVKVPDLVEDKVRRMIGKNKLDKFDLWDQYSIDAVKKPAHQRALNFEHMACQFTITAASPANPDIQVQEYNGAVCRWQVNPGVGENYWVEYADI